MYIPQPFRIEDLQKIEKIIKTYNFATLITCEGIPQASHIPFLYDASQGKYGTLVSHMAKNNPQWQSFEEDEVLAIFQGCHSYISPTWYVSKPAVCTWNYVAVHAYGIPKLITDSQRTQEILQSTVARYESQLPNPWDGTLPEQYREVMAQALVAFEIPLTRIEAQFKLGQNRSATDLQGVYRALSDSEDVNRQQLAVMMRQENLI